MQVFNARKSVADSVTINVAAGMLNLRLNINVAELEKYFRMLRRIRACLIFVTGQDGTILLLSQS
jgi:hypothetical protein